MLVSVSREHSENRRLVLQVVSHEKSKEDGGVPLDDGFHFVARVIHVGIGLIVSVVEEDGEKGREGRRSVQAVAGPNAASSSGTCVTEH